MDQNFNNEQNIERRKYVRLKKTDVVKVHEFTVMDLGADINEYDCQAVSKNVSAGGVLFESEKNFEIGAVLKLELNLPGWEKFKSEFYKFDKSSRAEPLIVLATVMRVEVVEPQSLYDIGVCFSAIDEGHRWALLKYINESTKEL